MKPSLSLSSQSPTTLALASGLRLSSSVLRHRLPSSLNPTRLSILRHNLSELRFLSSSSSRTRTHLRPIQALEKDGKDGNGSVLVQDTIENNERVVHVELHKEATEAYMLSSTRKPLKPTLNPVHRRILYAMHELGLASMKLFKKCARVVGEVLGKFHPHGDTAVYDSLVRMA